MNSSISTHGKLVASKIKARKAPLSWRIKNTLRWNYLWGFICHSLAWAFSALTKQPVLIGELAIRVKRAGGEWIDYGIVSRRLVTDAFVAYVVDDWDGGANVIDNFNYHGCGTGTNAENATDSALQTECTTVLNPDSTRATGTKSQPAANQARSIGTATFDGSAAVTEHGVFTQAATGGGTLQDRSQFTAINVASGDSIQFTYTMTYTSGG